MAGFNSAVPIRLPCPTPHAPRPFLITPLLQHSNTPIPRRSAKAVPVRVEADQELGSHFKATYDMGEVAEASWFFIRELLLGK